MELFFADVTSYSGNVTDVTLNYSINFSDWISLDMLDLDGSYVVDEQSSHSSASSSEHCVLSNGWESSASPTPSLSSSSSQSSSVPSLSVSGPSSKASSSTPSAQPSLSSSGSVASQAPSESLSAPSLDVS